MPVDFALYPEDWEKRSRFVRHHRAKSRCEKCGVKNGEGNGRGWVVVLTAAHLFDKDKGNGSLMNLAALCQKCHFDHDSPDRRKKTRPQDFPYPWHENWTRWKRKKRKSGLWFLHPSLPEKFHITDPVKFGVDWEKRGKRRRGITRERKWR